MNSGEGVLGAGAGGVAGAEVVGAVGAFTDAARVSKDGGGWGPPACKQVWSAWRISSAERYRFSGSFSSDRRSTAWREIGVSGLTSRGGGGAFIMCCARVAQGVSARNGG